MNIISAVLFAFELFIYLIIYLSINLFLPLAPSPNFTATGTLPDTNTNITCRSTKEKNSREQFNMEWYRI